MRHVTLQTEDLAQFTPARCSSVIIFRLFRQTRKTTVALRQIFLLQVLIRRLVTGDSCPPQFLDQSVLVRGMIAFHPSLGLRRTGSDDPNAQLLTYASELGHRHIAPQLLARRGFSPIHIFPVGVERAWHPVVVDLRRQRTHGCLDGFLLSPCASGSCCLRRRPSSSGKRADPAPPARVENVG